MATSSDEFDLIDFIAARAAPAANVPVGIGDDAAVIRTPNGDELLVACDTILEGTHFRIPEHDPRLIGRKSLAVNLSDIAAMAGRPTAAFVGLSLRRGRRFAEELMEGLIELAAEFDVSIAGGDTTSWDGPLAITVTALGEPTGAGPVLRSGAKPGDVLYVTGPLGRSFETGHHLSFRPRVAEAIRLHQSIPIHAMIDISDGLLSDLGHLCRASGVGAAIDLASVPRRDGAPIAEAISTGEDFELLFATPQDITDFDVIPIGKLTEQPELVESASGRLLSEFSSREGYRHSL
ncbi:thiamine-phosphate kinase [Stratiformator vulcanicus]|uniref:Thiamine-monophosphate kinase n=1 Tax=Stratiformator vulcanicus TaxID=2527980 RepID=A0A517QX43_9PLAN|nr:thiamine-phosphate kinase [Stratiformator vulcanicus]QDT36211.1 Thiamine-monophosphate kinase [Stratiformator vulcanicus]